MTRLLVRGSVLGVVALAVLATAPLQCAQPVGNAPAGVAVYSPNANVFGASLAEWLTEYWRWNFTGDTSAPYRPGRQPIVFLPIPSGTQTGGDWSPDDPGVLVGELEVTVPTGTHMVLPFFAWTAERYEGYPEVPDDSFIPDEKIDDIVVDLSITMDGKPVVEDWLDYYVSPTVLDPMIAYPAPTVSGAVGVIGWQGPGVVYKPLPPGRHVLHLYEQLRITDNEMPGVNVGVIYDNTWTINVVPAGRAR